MVAEDATLLFLSADESWGNHFVTKGMLVWDTFTEVQTKEKSKCMRRE